MPQMRHSSAWPVQSGFFPKTTMYLPPAFAETDVQELHRIMRENALGMLITHTANGLEANHLPLLLDDGVLIAHVARANPLWREVRDGDEVLAVFRGAQGYISPNWYPSKQETHRRVPTWNYEVVHAHGTIHVRDEEKFVRRVVGLLTRQHEAGQPKPWKMADAPADFLQEQLGHIVGIEIRVQRLEAKRKLNQHHATPDREGAMAGLETQGNHALAQAMRSTALPQG